MASKEADRRKAIINPKNKDPKDQNPNSRIIRKENFIVEDSLH